MRPLPGIGNQNVAVGINSNRSRRIKFSFPGAFATFEHVTDSFRQRTELGRWRVGYLINYHSVVIGRLVHLRKISGINLLIRSFNELSLANSIIIGHIANAIRFQEMIHFPRILALKQFCINPVAIARVVTG